MRQLLRLRQFLDSKLVDLAIIDDKYLRQVKYETIMDEIRDDVSRLRELMQRLALAAYSILAALRAGRRGQRKRSGRGPG